MLLLPLNVTMEYLNGLCMGLALVMVMLINVSPCQEKQGRPAKYASNNYITLYAKQITNYCF